MVSLVVLSLLGLLLRVLRRQPPNYDIGVAYVVLNGNCELFLVILRIFKKAAADGAGCIMLCTADLVGVCEKLRAEAARLQPKSTSSSSSFIICVTWMS